MKIYGINGKGTGRVGNMVFSVRNGEQIVRQYNPVVSNPQTDAQVASRSRLKLMSQLAAILAPAIAIPADGLKSKRNLFISQNYDLSFFNDGVAQINLDQIQLTKSSVAFSGLEVARDANTGITAQLSGDVHLNFDRVIYVVIAKQADGSFSLFASKVIRQAGANGNFPATLPYTASPICLYAYGIRANDDSTLTRFDSILADSQMNVAAVATRSRDLLANITYSITRGVVLEQGSDAGVVDSDKAQVTISKSPADGGTVTGAGAYDLGAQVTVTATPAAGRTFLGWKKGGSTVSTQASYTFTLSGNTNLVAQFSGGAGGDDDGVTYD